jgi:hypothetical protein
MDNLSSATRELAPLDVSSLTLDDLDSMSEEVLKSAVTRLIEGQAEPTLHTTHTNHTSHGIVVFVPDKTKSE